MNRMTLFVLTLGVFLTATSELVVSGVLSYIADDLRISLALAGQLVTAYSLAFAIGTPIIVSLTSRFVRKQVLIGALLVFVLGCAASYWSTTIVSLMTARVLLGIGSGVYLVVALSTAAKLVSPARLGSAIGTIILGFSSAMILGVPIGIAITEWLGWQAIFLILGLFSIGITGAVFRLLPAVEGDAAVPFLQQVKLLGSLTILFGLTYTLLRESGNSILFTFLAPFLQQAYRFDAAEISLAMLAIGVVGTVGARAGCYGVDRIGAPRVLTIAAVIHVAALLALPLFGTSVLLGFLSLSVIALSMFASGPAIQSYFIQQAPQSSGLVLSLNTSVVHLGLAAGAGAGGLLEASASTLRYHPLLAGAVIFLGLAAAMLSFSAGARQRQQGLAVEITDTNSSIGT